MKNVSLSFLAWPASAVAVLAAFFAVLLSQPCSVRLNIQPLTKTPLVKYAPSDACVSCPPEDNIQIRALYASDLFGSTRLNRQMAYLAVSNNFHRSLVEPIVTPVIEFSTGPIGLPQAFCSISSQDSDTFDPPFRTQHSHKTLKRDNPQFLIELCGRLKNLELDNNMLQGIAPLPDNKPRMMEAHIRLNAEGYVQQVLADKGDFEPAIFQAILKKLYRARFSKNVTPCKGTIRISYPFYTASTGTNALPNAP